MYSTCIQNLAILALAVPEIWLRASKLKMGHVTLTTPLLRVVVIDKLGFDTVYLSVKFDDSSCSRSRDKVGAHQNLNGSRDLTMPFRGWFVIHGLALSAIDLSTKFEVYLHPLRRYEKGYNISKMRWFGVVRGHPRSSKKRHSIECIRVPINVP